MAFIKRIMLFDIFNIFPYYLNVNAVHIFSRKQVISGNFRRYEVYSLVWPLNRKRVSKMFSANGPLPPPPDPPPPHTHTLHISDFKAYARSIINVLNDKIWLPFNGIFHFRFPKIPNDIFIASNWTISGFPVSHILKILGNTSLKIHEYLGRGSPLPHIPEIILKNIPKIIYQFEWISIPKIQEPLEPLKFHSKFFKTIPYPFKNMHYISVSLNTLPGPHW